MVGCGGNGGGGSVDKPSPPSTVEPNETIITGNLVEVRVISGDYPWELDVKVFSASDVVGRKNLIKAQVDQVITARTKQYLLGFSKGQGITCNMRVEGDEKGTYNVAWDIH